MKVFRNVTLWRPGGWLRDARLGIAEGRIVKADTTADAIDLGGALVTPGFCDLQVNGGGGLMLGACRTEADLARIVAAHRATGTTSILPTLISDTVEQAARIGDLIERHLARGGTGILGLHLEGPHIARPGIHNPALLQDMTAEDLELYRDLSARLRAASDGRLMLTVAPERVTAAQLALLTEAGVIVSLGHTDCLSSTAARLYAEGVATHATHLFNAMGGLRHRDPGLALAALQAAPWIGLIADNVHVAGGMLDLADTLAPDRLFLVSDAMAVAGTDTDGFDLQGKTIHRRNGRLTGPDGTLAGADLTLARAVRLMAEATGQPHEAALRMAIDRPLSSLGQLTDLTAPGRRADLLRHDANGTISILTAEGDWQPVRT